MIARVVAVVREGLSQSEAIRKALVEAARRGVTDRWRLKPSVWPPMRLTAGKSPMSRR